MGETPLKELAGYCIAFPAISDHSRVSAKAWSFGAFTSLLAGHQSDFYRSTSFCVWLNQYWIGDDRSDTSFGDMDANARAVVRRADEFNARIFKH